MASRERIESQFEQYKKALNTLEEAIELESHENSENMKLKIALRDAGIQRFEYTFEVLWKLLKRLAEDRDIKSLSPRDSFKAAFKMELIDQEFEETLVNMIEKRNLTVHTYKEEIAADIYEFIKNQGIQAFINVKNNIKSYLQ